MFQPTPSTEFLDTDIIISFFCVVIYPMKVIIIKEVIKIVVLVHS